MPTGKKWTLAGAAAVAVAVSIHFTAGGSLWPAERVVRRVRVKQGQLAGLLKTTDSGFEYLSFQGIPYATPPMGDLRFKAPREGLPWEGELEAFRDGASCMQVRDTKFKQYGVLGVNAGWADLLLLLASVARVIATLLTIRESEDCLFLNVFTPAERPAGGSLLPVLVFIHGGGFVRGSAHSAIYGPDYLVERGVVLVTLNYRLGAFGFLSTNSSDSTGAAGNAGLKDQALALRWVRDNVAAFGGDPARVTLYGESAGSASVHLHVLSPLSAGLFHAAILSSSSALSAYVMTEDPAVHSELLARALGADDEAVVGDPRRRVDYMRAKTSSEVAWAFGSCFTEEDKRHIVTKLPFGAVVEHCEVDDQPEEHFLCQRPEDILRSGSFNKVPMLFGQNLHEGTLIHALDSVPEVLDKIHSDATTLVPRSIYSRLGEGERLPVARKIQQHYLHSDAPNDTLPLIDLYGDLIIGHSNHIAMKWHIRHSTAAQPVFVYHFTRDVFGFYKLIYGIQSIKGPGHADELAFVFKIHLLNDKYFPNKEKSDSAKTIMTELITNFVQTHEPWRKNSIISKAPWLPATSKNQFYLEIGETVEMKTDLLKDRMQFLDSLYSQITRDEVYN